MYRSSAGIGGPNLVQLQTYIDNLNRFYNVDNHTLIGFYMKCQIDYIDNDDNVDVGDLEAWSLIQSHKEPGCINVHIVNTINGATGISYRTRFFGVDAIFVASATYTQPDYASTLSHEVGHYFELDHTHQYSNKGKCRKEAIDRNRTWPFISFCPFGGGGPSSQRICEATGDGLSDTPADPDLSPNFSCTFGLTGLTDPWGDHYESPPSGSAVPDTRNIMSYNGDRACRVVFSRRQIAVLLYSIYNGKSRTNRAAWQDARGEYDEYEMDNFSEAARQISLNEIQERNFNQQYNGGVVWGQCDVDWVSFVSPCSSNFEVFTSAIAGRTNANTRLTLFDNNLIQLAQNDDISGTNQFSSISWNFVAGQQYFIRVENMNNLTTGYYNLQIGRFSISGNSSFCTSSIYSVLNLPTGATVTWSATPTGVVSFNPVGPTTNPTTTVSRITNGNVTIQATVDYCGNQFIFSLPVVVGPTTPSDIIGLNPPLAVSPGEILELSISETGNSYLWEAEGGTIIGSNNQQNVVIQVDQCPPNIINGYINVHITITDGCGTGNTYTEWTTVDCSTGGPYFAMSPNPATNNVTIDGTAKNKKIKEVRIIDRFGNVKRVITYTGDYKVVNINTSGLTPGIYFIRIFDGNQWESKILSIQ